MLEDDPDAAFIAGADATPVAETPAPATEETKPVEEPKADTDGEPRAEEPAEGETDEPKADSEEDKPRKPWFQTRIDQVTREKHEANRRAEALEQQLAQVLEAVQRQQSQAEGTETDAAPQPPRGVPQPPQMTAEQIRAEAQRIVAEQTFTQTCNDIFAKGETAFKGDWTAAVATLNSALPNGITPDLVDAAVEVGDPHKTLHYLGKNPEIAQEIASLSPARMAVRLSKIAGDLNKPAAPRPVSRAPAPVTPIGPGPNSTDKSPEDMTMDEFIRWDEERQAKRVRR